MRRFPSARNQPFFTLQFTTPRFHARQESAYSLFLSAVYYSLRGNAHNNKLLLPWECSSPTELVAPDLSRREILAAKNESPDSFLNNDNDFSHLFDSHASHSNVMHCSDDKSLPPALTDVIPKGLFDGKMVLFNTKIGLLTIGVVNVEFPSVAEAISTLLVRSISDARQSNAVPGHLPDHMVDYLIQNYISPDKVKSLWAPYGKRFAILRNQRDIREIIGSVHVASSPDTILYYNRLTHNVPERDYPNFKPKGYHHIMNLCVKHELRKTGIAKTLIKTISTDFRDFFLGRGLWMRADPPWHNKLVKLGFKHDPSMDSFLGEDVEKTLEFSHSEYNQQYDCHCSHPNPDNPANLLTRSERLKKEKLQYFSFTFDFDSVNQNKMRTLPVNDLAIATAATILKFFQYKLDTAPNGFQFEKKKVLDTFTFLYCKTLASMVLGLYCAALKNVIEILYILSNTELHALEKAEQFTRYDIQMDDQSIIQPIPLSSIAALSSETTNVEMRDSLDIEKFKVEDVSWHRIEEYVVDRIDGISRIIDTLKPSDEIIVSNLGIEYYVAWLNKKSDALANKKEILQLDRISLPVSSYEKEIWLIRLSDHTQTLLFSKIKGENYLLHYRLLIKRYLSQKKQRVILSALTSTTFVHANHSTLNSFFLQCADKFDGTTSLVFGYAPVFQFDWSKHFQETVFDSKNQWRADIYILSNSQKICVLSTRLPMHGEILAKEFSQALGLIPTVRHLFVGGTAGSLSAQIPYEMVFPSMLEVSSSHQIIQNILSADNHLSIIHASVLSPLVETPEFLADLSRKGIQTIDMEVGYLAELPSKYPHITIGLGVILTDFPKHLDACKSVTLFTKDLVKHNQAKHSFTAAIYRYLLKHQKTYHSAFERQFGSVKALSEKNLQAEKERLGELSPLELQLKTKLMQELNLSFSIRLSPTRLWQALGDKVLLSPELVNAFAERKATALSPILENQIFGAKQYIFGEIGIGNGSKEYGSVVIKVKDSCWKKISWATKYSAWWAASRLEKQSGRFFISDAATIDNEADLKLAQDQFIRWVFDPAHYLEAIALLTLSHLRGKSVNVFREFLNASSEELTKLIQIYNFAKLEGKIYQSLELDDIEKILLPPNASPELQRRLQENNISFEWLENNPINHENAAKQLSCASAPALSTGSPALFAVRSNACNDTKINYPLLLAP